MLSRHRRWLRRAVTSLAVIGVALALAACTEEPEEETPQPPVAEDEEPAPQLGAEVVVVLPPRTVMAPEVAAAIGEDLQTLEETYADDLRRVRTRFPDEGVFVRDVATLDARDGADLVCILGSVGRQIGPELLETHPSTRFCATTPNDLPEEVEDGYEVVALATGDLGHLLGSAARELAGGDPVVIALGSTEMERGSFAEGLQAALGPSPIVELDDDLPPQEAMAGAVDDGASVAVIGTGPDGAALTAAALEAGLQVITHAAFAEVGDDISLAWNLRWDLVLVPAVDRLLGRQAFSELQLGLGDEVFAWTIGPAAPDGLAAQLESVEAELLAGSRDPLEATLPEEPAEPEDAEQPEDDEGVDNGEDPDDEAAEPPAAEDG
jgi:hypothetical protein